jgi:hypothetical protein
VLRLQLLLLLQHYFAILTDPRRDRSAHKVHRDTKKGLLDLSRVPKRLLRGILRITLKRQVFRQMTKRRESHPGQVDL